MADKKRLTAEEYDMQIAAVKKIAEYTELIKNELPNFMGVSVKTAYENSVKNLEKKNELYGKEKFLVSEDEKELLRKIRAGEVKVAPIKGKTN